MGINNLFGLGTPGFGGAFGSAPINQAGTQLGSAVFPQVAPNRLIDGPPSSAPTGIASPFNQGAQPPSATPPNLAVTPSYQPPSATPPNLAVTPSYQPTDINSQIAKSMGMLGFSGLGFGR